MPALSSSCSASSPPFTLEEFKSLVSTAFDAIDDLNELHTELLPTMDRERQGPFFRSFLNKGIRSFRSNSESMLVNIQDPPRPSAATEASQPEPFKRPGTPFEPHNSFLPTLTSSSSSSMPFGLRTPKKQKQPSARYSPPPSSFHPIPKPPPFFYPRNAQISHDSSSSSIDSMEIASWKKQTSKPEPTQPVRRRLGFKLSTPNLRFPMRSTTPVPPLPPAPPPKERPSLSVSTESVMKKSSKAGLSPPPSTTASTFSFHSHPYGPFDRDAESYIPDPSETESSLVGTPPTPPLLRSSLSTESPDLSTPPSPTLTRFLGERHPVYRSTPSNPVARKSRGKPPMRGLPPLPPTAIDRVQNINPELTVGIAGIGLSNFPLPPHRTVMLDDDGALSHVAVSPILEYFSVDSPNSVSPTMSARHSVLRSGRNSATSSASSHPSSRPSPINAPRFLPSSHVSGRRQRASSLGSISALLSVRIELGGYSITEDALPPRVVLTRARGDVFTLYAPSFFALLRFCDINGGTEIRLADDDDGEPLQPRGVGWIVLTEEAVNPSSYGSSASSDAHNVLMDARSLNSSVTPPMRLTVALLPSPPPREGFEIVAAEFKVRLPILLADIAGACQRCTIRRQSRN